MATRSFSNSAIGFGTKNNSFSYAASIYTNLISATGTFTKNANNSYSFTTDGTFGFYPKGVPKSTAVTSKSVEYLVVAGGGAGGSNAGGGGGAGGYLTSTLSITPGFKTVTVGAGGASPTIGSSSVLAGITSLGGGRGHDDSNSGGIGGSGGGAGSANSGPGGGTAGQGFGGGSGFEPAVSGKGAGGGVIRFAQFVVAVILLRLLD